MSLKTANNFSPGTIRTLTGHGFRASSSFQLVQSYMRRSLHVSQFSLLYSPLNHGTEIIYLVSYCSSVITNCDEELYSVKVRDVE